jgi:hypothetical protein
VAHNPVRAIPILAGAVGVLLLAAPLPGSTREPVGIVIETLGPGSVVAQAGLVPGDVGGIRAHRRLALRPRLGRGNALGWA